MIPDLAEDRRIVREAAERVTQHDAAQRSRVARLVRLALKLAILAALLWAAWRVGYETAAVTHL